MNSKTLQSLQQYKWFYFSVLVILSIGLSYIIHDIIITDPKYFTKGNNNSVGLYRKIYGVLYLVKPVSIFLKVSCISLLLYWGTKYYLKLKSSVSFWMCFTLVCLSEFIFLIPDISEAVYFLIIQTNYTMQDVYYFNWYSLYSILGQENMPKAFVHPLQLINIFEFLYWAILALLFSQLGNLKYIKGIQLIALFYLLPLFIYTAIKFFINLIIFS
nr:hypothetical protein [uncultured Marinifilum sp.]